MMPKGSVQKRSRHVNGAVFLTVMLRMTCCSCQDTPVPAPDIAPDVTDGCAHKPQLWSYFCVDLTQGWESPLLSTFKERRGEGAGGLLPTLVVLLLRLSDTSTKMSSPVSFEREQGGKERVACSLGQRWEAGAPPPPCTG